MRLSAEDYMRGVLEGNRTMLARAITLVESSAPAHRPIAEEVVDKLLPRTGKAKRIGITGVPGVGKSTFIEAFGGMLCGKGLKVAVLAVDPTSARSGGSILGDKTRMEQLSRHPNAYIRPSPAGDTLGGVAGKTRETLLLCEAAGFDVVLVETVGVGQSEISVRNMVDFFLLMLLPGGGDELQGIKRGVVELADALFVNKADGDNLERAEIAKREYATAVRYLAPATRGWRTEVYAGSSLTGQGLSELWELIERFYEDMGAAGFISERRSQQATSWLTDLIREELKRRFYSNERIQSKLPELERALCGGRISAAKAARELFEGYDRRSEKND